MAGILYNNYIIMSKLCLYYAHIVAVYTLFKLSIQSITRKMKGTVRKSGNGLHIMIKKSGEFSEGDEVLIQHYEKDKDSNICQFDIAAIKEAVAEAIAES